MPELPEVETVASELRAQVVGATIERVAVTWERTIASPTAEEFARLLTGQTIIEVWRRGKWIVLTLDRSQSLLVHLRMTGRLRVVDDECDDTRYLRVRIALVDGRAICFTDMRKFGRMRLVGDVSTVLGDLGPEPLAREFTAARLADMLAPRRGRIKPLLLDQSFLAGLGNIYTDEALWRARIHPLRTASSLTRAEVGQLHAAIRGVLRRATASSGTTLDDGGFVGTSGKPGEFAALLAVYGREGAPCPLCGTRIERIRVSQRGTHLCVHCQEPAGAE
jgi:formamidopyrimidine-DNA glycosylase